MQFHICVVIFPSYKIAYSFLSFQTESFFYDRTSIITASFSVSNAIPKQRKGFLIR
jgi:hypothetical protein